MTENIRYINAISLHPRILEAMSAVLGKSESNLGIYVKMLIESGYASALVAQEPDFYCPTGTHTTDIAIKLSYVGDPKTIPQMNGEPVSEIRLCPNHVAPVLTNIPSWPSNYTREKVIFDPNNISQINDHEGL